MVCSISWETGKLGNTLGENDVKRVARRIALAWMIAALGPLSSLTINSADAQTIELAQAPIIDAIEVRGSQRVEPGTVLSYLLVREGDQFNPRRIDRSLKSLFATGLFSDVTLTRSGNTLIVNVVENPVINRLEFEGNDQFEDETLEAEVSLRPRVIYTRTKSAKRRQTHSDGLPSKRFVCCDG